MTELHYVPSFEEDVLAIWLRIAAENPTAADKLVERIYERCLLLQDHPLAGPPRTDIAPECRHLVVGPILILYRHREGRVDLVRAIDSRRDITGEMFTDGTRP